MELRPVAAVVEAASSFAAAADSRRSSDQTFQLLAYAPAKSASAIRSKAQAADAADTSGVASSKRQPGNCMERSNRSLGGISTAKQADRATQPFVQATPIQSHDSSRRLAFQSGSGFASGSSTAAQQRQGIPDLTRLMCSADSGSEYDVRKGSTPVMQGRGKHGRAHQDPKTPPWKGMLSIISSAMHHLAAECLLLRLSGPDFTTARHESCLVSYLLDSNKEAVSTFVSMLSKGLQKSRVGIHAGDGDSRDLLHDRQTERGVNEGDPEAHEAAKRPVGTAWRDGSHMTVPMTTMYELNPATGQVGPLF